MNRSLRGNIDECLVSFAQSLLCFYSKVNFQFCISCRYVTLCASFGYQLGLRWVQRVVRFTYIISFSDKLISVRFHENFDISNSIVIVTFL